MGDARTLEIERLSGTGCSKLKQPVMELKSVCSKGSKKVPAALDLAKNRTYIVRKL
jgi:hypothetical protein